MDTKYTKINTVKSVETFWRSATTNTVTRDTDIRQ